MAAVCGGLGHIFERPLPETSTLLESLSPWKSMKTVDHSDSSFTELFGELHFKENHLRDPPKSSACSDANPPTINKNESLSIHLEKSGYCSYEQKKQYGHGHSDSFSSMNSESLSICTEGLGFESCDDAEDLSCNNDCQEIRRSTRAAIKNDNHMRGRTSIGTFPPPISCIGKSGKPWVCFKSFRQDGRFILKEIRIPTQEFLHACRENGRLKLQFVQSDDEFLEEDDDEEEKTVKETNENSGNNDDDRDEPELDRNGQQNVET